MNIKEFLDWQELADRLKKLKLEEARIRIELSERIFNGQYKTTTKEVEGYKVKASAKINIKIDEAVFNSIYPKLSIMEKEAVKLKPIINKQKYNLLSEGCLLETAIIESPGRPTLNIKRI